MKRSKTISFLFACPKYILFVVNYFLLEKVKTREVFFSLVKTKMELQFDCVVKRSKTIFFPCACPKYILFVVNYFLLEKAKTFSFSFPYQFFSSPHFFSFHTQKTSITWIDTKEVKYSHLKNGKEELLRWIILLQRGRSG